MTKRIILTIILFAPTLLNASEPGRFVTKLKLPSGQTAVIAEGDFEARSIGSFSVRLYDAATAGDKTTFFSAGLVHARDGSIETVLLEDIDDDQHPEIIVTARSVGTGGYLSAYAIAFARRSLVVRAVEEGLPATADPVTALKESVRKAH